MTHLRIEVPAIERVAQRGVAVTRAARGGSWSEEQLGSFAKQHGVYVIHHRGSIKYVGKTNGLKMTFGVRLRREFQETAAQGKHIYPRLAGLDVPPEIYVSFLAVDEVNKLVKAEGFEVSDEGAIDILEQALIHAYRPEFQYSGTRP